MRQPRRRPARASRSPRGGPGIRVDGTPRKLVVRTSTTSSRATSEQPAPWPLPCGRPSPACRRGGLPGRPPRRCGEGHGCRPVPQVDGDVPRSARTSYAVSPGRWTSPGQAAQARRVGRGVDGGHGLFSGVVGLRELRVRRTAWPSMQTVMPGTGRRLTSTTEVSGSRPPPPGAPVERVVDVEEAPRGRWCAPAGPRRRASRGRPRGTPATLASARASLRGGVVLVQQAALLVERPLGGDGGCVGCVSMARTVARPAASAPSPRDRGPRDPAHWVVPTPTVGWRAAWALRTLGARGEADGAARAARRRGGGASGPRRRHLPRRGAGVDLAGRAPRGRLPRDRRPEHAAPHRRAQVR